MANKRIKDLGTTASTLAADDYVAIDGNANGTRKIVKGDLVNDISTQVAGTYLDEANNLSDVASKDTSKLNLEVPDVGTAPNEVPLNGQLGSMAYQSADSVSVDTLEVTDKVDGSLGIDVTPTASKLEVSGTTNSSLMMTRTSSGIVSNLEDAAGYGSLLLYQAGGSAKVSIQGNGNSYFNGGSVGIGGSPTRKLELQKTGFLGSSTLGSPTDSTVSIDVRGNSSTDIVQGEVLGAYTLDAYDSSGATGGGVTQNSGLHFVAGNHFGASASSVDLAFATGANGSTAERVRIDSSGRLGVGTAVPDFALDVAGDMGIDEKIYHNGDNNTYLQFNSDQFTVRTGGTDRLIVNNTAIQMGTGMGIDFGSTADGSGATGVAEIFDDYETGTVTVGVTTTTGSITLNSSFQYLYYTKIGRTVNFFGELVISSVSSPTGSIAITGLPFTSLNQSGSRQAMSIYTRGLASDLGSVVGFVEPNSTSLYLRESGTTSVGNAIAPSFQANTEIMVGGSYTAA